jgi:hypothetical protein
MTRRPWAALLAVAVASALLLTGCGKEELGGTPGKQIKVLPASTVPATIAGLSVKPEKVNKALEKAKHSYVNAVGFYSLRKGKTVQGTLQVSQFGPEARLEEQDFRTEIVQQASPGAAEPVNVGGKTVQQSGGTKSTVSVWFSEDRMVILTVLKSYTGGRSLLEQTLVALPAT